MLFIVPQISMVYEQPTLQSNDNKGSHTLLKLQPAIFPLPKHVICFHEFLAEIRENKWRV